MKSGQVIPLINWLVQGFIKRRALNEERTYPKQSPETFYKKGVLQNFIKLTEKHMYISESLQIYQKAAPTQVFSCEICEIFKNTYFEEHVRTTSSVSESPFQKPCGL